MIFQLGIWRTQLTEDVGEEDREFQVKTTLRELIIYVSFIVVLCISKPFLYYLLPNHML